MRKGKWYVWNCHCQLSNENELRLKFASQKDNRDEVEKWINENLNNGIKIDKVWDISRGQRFDILDEEDE